MIAHGTYILSPAAFLQKQTETVKNNIGAVATFQAADMLFSFDEKRRSEAASGSSFCTNFADSGPERP